MPAPTADRACVCPATGLSVGDVKEKSRRKTQFLPLRGALTGQQNGRSAYRWPVGAGLLPAPGEAELLVASVWDLPRDGGNRGARVTPGLETAPPRGVGLVPYGTCRGRGGPSGRAAAALSRPQGRAQHLSWVSGRPGILQDVRERSPREPRGRERSAAPVRRVLLGNNVPFHPDFRNALVSILEGNLFHNLRLRTTPTGRA